MTRIGKKVIPAVRLFCWTILFATLSTIVTRHATAQANWSGQVQCQLDDQDQNYSRHEVQTWTLAGGGPLSADGMPVYEATWSVTGQGALQRVQGGQTTNIQWTTNVPPTRATIAIFVRGSDNRLIIKPWHSQERMDYALNGMRQIVVNGVAQQPTNFSKSVWEWQFPRIEDSPTNTNVSGSTQSQAEAGDAELLHHYGGLPPAATCRWQFTKGGMSTTNSNQSGMNGGQSTQNPQGSMSGNTNYQSNGQSCESPATVQQSFENMKANLQTQYTQLIQGTSDPTQVAALTSQEQRMLATMNAQEQHDMAAASQGCVQASQGGNPHTGGSSNAGGAGNASAGTAGAGSAGAGAGNPYAGGAPGAGSNSGAAGGAATGAAGASGSNSYAGGGPSNAGSNSGTAGAASSGSKGGAGNNASGGAGANGSAGAASQPMSPQLLSLTPSNVSQGSTVQVNLVGQGTHWTNATNVSFGPQVTLQSFTADPSGTSAVATINVASNAALGSRPVMLMTGAEMVGSPGGLTVTAASSQQGSSGTNSPPMRIDTGSGFSGSNIVLAGVLTGVSPATNNGLQNLTVTLTGQRTNFANGSTTVSFVRASQPGSTMALPANQFVAGLNHTTSAPPAVQVGPVNVSSPTNASVPLTINPTAAAGTYNVTVTTPTSKGTETLTLNNAFTVTATPTLSGVPLNPGGVVARNTGTTPAAPSSATYRVTMTGLMCMRHITGGGDAIYGAAVIRQYDRRSGQGTMSTNANTWVYGDTNGMIGQRLQAGTRGPLGGIQAGDFVPTGFIVGPKDTLPPQANIFPMTLFQGTLTDGIDALVISPSVWISYGDNSMFFNWNQNEDSLTNSIYLDSHVQNQINTQAFGTLSFGASQNVSGSANSTLAGDATVTAVETSVQAAGLTFGIPLGVFTAGPSHDRPIGVGPASADPTATTILPNATLVLTREIIEKHLGSNSWTAMSFDFKDWPGSFSSLPGADRPGEYQMFIQIERQ